MKKLALLCSSCCMMLLPAVGFSTSAFVPYQNNYAVTVKGHDGTLAKTQVISNNTYSITTQISISTLFSTKIIHQIATGTFTGTTITPGTFGTDQSGSMQTTTLSQVGQNIYDPLILVTYLSNALLNGGAVSSTPISLWYNGNVVPVGCSISNPNATTTIGSGASVSATQVTCATSDNATLVLAYLFSQDGQANMLNSTITENGTSVMAASGFTNNV